MGTAIGTTLILDNYYQSVGSLSGGGASGGNIQLTAWQGYLCTESSDNTTYSGSISGIGGLQKTGTGTLTLTGTNNSYSGGTDVAEGTLRCGAPNVLCCASGVSVATGATLAIGSYNQSVNGLGVGGTITGEAPR